MSCSREGVKLFHQLISRGPVSVNAVSAERLWFHNTVESVFLKALGERLTPPLREQLRVLGIDFKRPQPAYPADMVEQGVELVCVQLYPSLARAAAHLELGTLFMRSYTQTLIGKAMVGTMRVIGMRRTLERMQRNFSTGGNYMQCTCKHLGPGRVELWINDTAGLPTFWAGVVGEGARLIGVPANITSTPGAERSCTYLVSWPE